MRLLDIGHGAGVVIQPCLAEECVPAESDEKMDDDKHPDSKMMDFMAHKMRRLSRRRSLNCKPILALRLTAPASRLATLRQTTIRLVNKDTGLGMGKAFLTNPAVVSRCLQHYLNDIETKENIRIIQHPQPIECAARNAFLLLPIDGRKRPAEILPGARFHFYEDQSVMITANNVDLTAAPSLEVAVENLVAVTTREATRPFLAARAATEVLSLR
jgi:hypothetical protein